MLLSETSKQKSKKGQKVCKLKKGDKICSNKPIPRVDDLNAENKIKKYAPKKQHLK